MRRGFYVLATTLTLLLSMQTDVFAGTWIKSGNEWQYKDDNNNLYVNRWLKDVDGAWYHIGLNGYMTKSWYKSDAGVWYYLNPVSGRMHTGWLKDPGDSKWYYLGTEGELYVSRTTPDGYKVDSSGAYIEEGKTGKAANNSSGEDFLYDEADEVIRLVNEYRRQNGLGELAKDDRLVEAADIRAKELISKFDHKRPNGENFNTAIKVRYAYAGENLAMGQRSAAAVMDGWINSEGHRENILTSVYTSIGVSCYRHNGRLYWVQIFAAWDF